jgi:hypothetical protein
MMNRNFFGAAIFVAALLGGLSARDAFAHGHGGHGGHAFAGGTRGGFHHHHFHGRATFFFGGAFWPYYPPPYYYGPNYAMPHYEPPTVYVERFDGNPTPQTQGEIFCPSAGVYYPEVKQCPGGWQRVIRPQADAPEQSAGG